MEETRPINTPAGVLMGVVLGLLLIGGVLLTTAASVNAQQDPYSRDPYSNGEPTVAPRLITSDSTVERDDGEPPPLLPFTGGELTIFALAGFGAIAIGTVLVRRRRGDVS